MGQYYKVVNITKGQYLHPHEFGDGLKLLEFGASGNGTMMGLAVLLSSGNGRGGGDLSRQPVNKGKGAWENAGSFDPGPFERVEHEWVSESSEQGKQKYRIIVPDICGSWAGDRIVVAGDYADEGAFITEEMVKGKLREDYGITRYEKGEHVPLSGPIETTDMNLYEYAEKFFEDISLKVLWAMLDDSWFLKECTEASEKSNIVTEWDEIVRLKGIPVEKLPLERHRLMKEFKREGSKNFLESLVRAHANHNKKKPRRKKCTRASGKSSRSSSSSRRRSSSVQPCSSSVTS